VKLKVIAGVSFPPKARKFLVDVKKYLAEGVPAELLVPDQPAQNMHATERKKPVVCAYYDPSRKLACKFGAACRFDHPKSQG